MPISIHNKLPGIQSPYRFRRHHFRPVLCILRPWEACKRPYLRIPVPGIPSENFIRTFSGQGNLYILPDSAAENKKRKIHIRHSRQIPGDGAFLQRPDKLLRRQLCPAVVCVQRLAHNMNIFPVRIWLEFSGTEVPVIVPIVNAEGFQPLTPGCHLPGTQGGDDTGIQPT